MKSSALPIAMKISSLTRAGMPYLSMNSETLSSSWRSMNGWPSRSMGSSAGTIWIFSAQVSISVLRRMASAMPKGAGTPGVNSKLVKVPGFSRIAKAIRCAFHCSRSWICSSSNRFIMFGYAPKKMCSPVSIQSPSASCQAETLPPSTFRPSYTVGVCPASTRYFAHARPLSPPPITATVALLPPGRASCAMRSLSAAASR
mmetsp:Transcript_7443/g.18529  ORF Transcript_7443/g.18529 Transcript_7443/m.18529 type:complete len:201 (+) Transcript_7443:1110-1712(+)